MITRYKTPLLITLIVLFFVYLIVSGRPGSRSEMLGASVSDSKMLSPSTNSIPTYHSGANTPQVVKKQLPVNQPISLTGATQPNEYVAYMSGRLSGIIGMYAGNQTDNPVDNVFTVQIDRKLTNTDRVWLNYKLTGVIQYGGVSCSVNDRLSFGGYLVSTDTGTYKQRVRLHPDWLQQGENHIRFGLAAGAKYGYKVSDLAIEIEHVSEAHQAVIVNNCRTLFNGKAYIHGFINNDNRYKVEIDGKPVALRDGEFEAIVQPDADSVWLVASYKAKTFRKLLRFDKEMNANYCFELDTDIKRKEKLFAKNKAAQIETNLTTLTAPIKTILETRRITATDLRPIDLPALDLGMTNVTAENRGVRFLPHGEHFGGEGASVALKYDRTRIPDGYTEDDIRTFYFDPNTKHWVALERDTVDKSLCMVVSKTTHFTDMINGVIQTPESPETQGFAPTMMSDIKAADPTSKINLIAPPTANNQGSANLTYELELPPTRNGMNPNLAITYNSDGGSGWLGEGWDLNIPTISVDTRWGVPRYDSLYETETYSLGGTMLATVVDTSQNALLGGASVGHKGILYQRLVGLPAEGGLPSEGVQFHPVIENGFNRITRLGTNPTNYIWKVITKEGITYTYGELAHNAALTGNVQSFQYNNNNDKTKKLGTQNGVIAEWKLSSVEDQYRNFCRYYYSPDLNKVHGSNNATTKSIYLSRIEIGRKKKDGTSDSDTLYQIIRFLPKTQRQKQISNGRYGFLTSNTKNLLDEVQVELRMPNDRPNSVQSYKFAYIQGPFNSQLLSIVSQCDSAGTEVANHTFTYYDNINKNYFSSTEEIFNTTSVESGSNPYLAVEKGLPALGGSKSKTTSASFYVGASADFKLFGMGMSAGLGYNYSFSNSSSDSKMMMVDINGDGLPDKLYKGSINGNTRLCFIPNLGDRFGTTGIPIDGYHGDLSYTKSTSYTNGWRGNVNIGAGKNNSVTVDAGMDGLKGNSETSTYLSDVNSDGLVDIVSDGRVYFNFITSYDANGAGIPSFTTNSGLTARPILNIKTPRGKAQVLKLSDTFVLTPEPTKSLSLDPVDTCDLPIRRDITTVNREKTEDYAQVPMQDIVRFWEAPYTGAVNITTFIKYLGDTNVPDLDGVRLTIQSKIQNIDSVIWKDSIKPSANFNRERSTSNSIPVEGGQRIYFRLQSGSNYFSDFMEDVVLWKQTITYVDGGDGPLYKADGYYQAGVYESSEGSFVSQNYDNVLDSMGMKEADSRLIKPVTRDKIYLKMFFSTDSLISTDSTVIVIKTDTVFADSANTYVVEDTSYVKYKVWKRNKYYVPESAIYEKEISEEEVNGFESINFYYPDELQELYNESTSSIEIPCPAHYRFEISGNMNEEWDKIKWMPTLVFRKIGSDKDTTLYAGVKYHLFENKYNHLAHLIDKEATQKTSGSPVMVETIDFSVDLNSDRLINTKYTLCLYRYIGNSLETEMVKNIHGTIVNNSGTCQMIVDNFNGTDFHFFKLFINDTISSLDVTAKCKFTNYGPLYWDNYNVDPIIYCLQSNSRTQYGHMWRGWGQFQYNASCGRYNLPLKEDSLFMPSNMSNEEMINKWGINRMTMFNMSHKPYKSEYYWTGTNDNLLIKGDTICTGRLNLESMPACLSTPTPDQVIGDGSVSSQRVKGRMLISSATPPILSGTKYEITTAPTLANRSESTSAWGGASVNIGVLNAGGNYTHSSGSNCVTSAFMDLNGDGFPDYITDSKVEYTNQLGGRDGEITNLINETSNNESNSFGFSGGYCSSSSVEPQNRGAIEISSKLSMDLNASVGYSHSTNNTVTTNAYIDLNGDGLPDRVYKDKGKVYVCLNLGYGFSGAVYWGLADITVMRSTSNSVSASVGVTSGNLMSLILGNAGELVKWLDKLNLGVNAGVNHAKTTSYSMCNLTDVNMDGLPDKIYKNSTDEVAVEFNTGNGFSQAVTLKEMEDLYKAISTSSSANLSVSVKFKIFLVISVSISASGSSCWTNDYTLNQMLDIDGDGYPDIVKANDESSKLAELKVRRSLISYTNKLARVTNPLGGVIRMEYAHSKASCDHPGGKWVMNSLTINDGITDDGDSLKNKFSYERGKYDRYEREFLGFAAVTTENINIGSTTQTTYREMVQTFDNSNYYTRGALLTSTLKMIDGSTEKTYTETINKYRTYSVTRLANSANGDKLGKYVLKTMQNETDFTRENLFLNQYIVYAPTKYSLNKMYAYKDGIQSSLITSESYYDYYTAAGTHGELSLYLFSDKGNLGENASNNYNYKTEISYLRNKPTMTLFSLPESYTVTGNSGKLYRKTEAVWFDNFATQLKEVRQIIGNGDTSKVTLGYDRWGNLSQKELPAKNKADRMWYKYEYDKHYHLFPVKVSDKLGYSSTLSNYDYRFGIPRTTTDMNGNISTTTLDNLGRIVSITGPNEYDPNDPAKHTIKFEYYPGAVTKNTNGTINNPAYAITRHYDPLHPTDSIVTVTFVDGFGRPVQVKKDAVINGESKMIVSGRTRFDAFGRAVENYYPTVDELSNRTTFKRNSDAYKTVNTYDVLDRVLTTRLPDDATTTMSYGIADGKLVTTVTDAEGGKQQTFTNGSGLTVKTLQYKHLNPDTVLTTLFDYDGVNQLVKVTDDAGKITESIYDLAGRRTQVTHPASGITKFEYDVAGNLIAKQTANMLANNGNKKIQYFYAYNRLDSIVYPDHPENNVKYTYGAANDPVATRRGRLVSQEDGSGAQEFSYGKQGELTQVRRTLVIPNQAVATYVTGWTYDSWNRLLEMTYPDGEKVNYSYNTGGLLTAVASSANTYVSNILYDKFEQRTSLTYGNGAVTTYQYNPANRQLNNLSVVSNNNTIMNNTYGYDNVGNIDSIVNTGTAMLTSGSIGGTIGGKMKHVYKYDKLYRLKEAHGTYSDGITAKAARYDLYMGYDNMHNIVSKKQRISQTGVQFDGTLQAGYDLNYTINANNSQQIANIAESNYRTEGNAANTPVIKESNFIYDANGNLLSIYSGTKTADDKLQVTQSRNMLWDEENRLLGISDNGYVSNYWYDASGERTVKMSGGSEGVAINGVPSVARTETKRFTAYISPYLTVRNGGEYTKHVYMGNERITSKVSNSGIFGTSPVNDTLQAKYQLQTAKIKERFDTLGVKYNGSTQSGGLISNSPSSAEGSYFYHSDHLGSSSLITSQLGDIVQHLEYVPFGETFIDQRNGSWNTPYLFNGKERDEETGLLYVHARYQDSKYGIWYSVDPLAEKFANWSSYVYCHNNPVRFIDPTGESGEDTSGKPSEINKTTGVPTAAQSSVRTIEPTEKITPQITLNPNYGEIRSADALTTAEMWLNSPSTSGGELVGKIAANIGYSLINSPYSLITGQSLGGTPLNSVEKQEAFIDVVPGLLSGGLTKTGAVIKTTEKGIKGFNQFVKSTGAATTKGLPVGMSWQKNASKLFKANSVSQGGIKSLDVGLKVTGGIGVIKKEDEKGGWSLW